ncbi:response regulator [Roseivirga seohaensis]|uniref:Chemotaxis protein CheY n=2 Tax=Roseivirga seohaensis TaxID=1914963 RepID=A0A0L8ALX9_9BACT|nr:response regulator [Roseivirga seohaensis]KOF03217.1 chemotaxis protein CheY [Roseivirga seohaensis subsp. aquiponti]KYG79941.1 two-component system response regulator [Roseivirga seohaensis]
MSPSTNLNPISILMADDDPDDQLMAKEAFEENRMANDLNFVQDGEELMDYLQHRGKYNAQNAPKPGLILLDLNMPKKDGRTALREIKADPKLKRIPIVVLTTSKSDEDVFKTYDLGVSSFITKPVTFEELVEVTKDIGKYWFGIVVLPKDNE